MAELRTRPQSSRSTLRRGKQATRNASRSKRAGQQAAVAQRKRAQRSARQRARYVQSAKPATTDTVGAPSYAASTATPKKNTLDDFLSGFKGPGGAYPEQLEELEEEEQSSESRDRKREKEDTQEEDPADAATVLDERSPEQRAEDAKADTATVLDGRSADERVQEAHNVDAATVLDERPTDERVAEAQKVDAQTVVDRPKIDPDAPTVPTAPRGTDAAKTDLAKPPVPETAGKGAAKAGKKAAETGAKAAAEGAKGAAADVAGKAAVGAGKEAAGAAAKGAAKAAAKTAAKEGGKAAVKGGMLAAEAATGPAGLAAGAVLDEGIHAAEVGAEAAKKLAKGDVGGAIKEVANLTGEEIWNVIQFGSLLDAGTGGLSFIWAFFGTLIAIFRLGLTGSNPKGAMKGGDDARLVKGMASFVLPPAIKPTSFTLLGLTALQAIVGCVILIAVGGVMSVLAVFFIGMPLIGIQELGEALGPIGKIFSL